MRLIFTLFIVLLSFQLQAQSTFIFDLFFEDTLGNRDTVTIGYDLNATYGIDSAFGEEDISNIPWDTNGLDVRVITENGYQTIISIQDPYFFYTCYHTQWQDIGVYTKHWPVTVSWDSTQFVGCTDLYGLINYEFAVVKNGDPCLFHGIWEWYSTRSSVIFPNANPLECSYNYIASNTPDSTKLLSSTYQIPSNINEVAHPVNLYPNPANDDVRIELNTGSQPIDWVIYSVTGQVVYSEQTRQSNPTLDVSGIPNGTYMLIGQSNDEVYRQKLMVLKE